MYNENMARESDSQIVTNQEKEANAAVSRALALDEYVSRFKGQGPVVEKDRDVAETSRKSSHVQHTNPINPQP